MAPLCRPFASLKAHGTPRSSAGRSLGTRSTQRIVTEPLLLTEAKRPRIVVHGLRHSAAPSGQVQRMMQRKHSSTSECYARDAQHTLEGAEWKMTQIQGMIGWDSQQREVLLYR
ncbi:MAG: hypothetical protein U0236_08330 [Nitrospira sp.]